MKNVTPSNHRDRHLTHPTAEALPAHRADDLPAEVTHSPLAIYSDVALAGRLAHYEREALLERDPSLRAAFKIEVTRTKEEIEQRRRLNAAGAEALFQK